MRLQSLGNTLLPPYSACEPDIPKIIERHFTYLFKRVFIRPNLAVYLLWSTKFLHILINKEKVPSFLILIRKIAERTDRCQSLSQKLSLRKNNTVTKNIFYATSGGLNLWFLL